LTVIFFPQSGRSQKNILSEENQKCSETSDLQNVTDIEHFFFQFVYFLNLSFQIIKSSVYLSRTPMKNLKVFKETTLFTQNIS